MGSTSSPLLLPRQALQELQENFCDTCVAQMARLNEPLMPAAESLDALKRRFIRQNREIARVNSTQSQRIRNLETEISRLLAENIALREQAIRANEKAEKLRTSSRLGRDVLALKGVMVAKWEELGSLLEDLGGLPEKSARRSSMVRRKSGPTQSLLRSPDAREWRSRQTLGGILNPEQEGRLPAIMEDKYYPRRTLEPAELRALGVEESNGDIESPELGPPPVVHFDVNEPIVFDSQKSPRRISDVNPVDEEEFVALPGNFETRRKRRTSSLVHDLPSVDGKKSNKHGTTSEQQDASNQGQKRRVDASELDQSRPPTIQDDFVFQRKSNVTTDRPRPSRFTSRPERTNVEEPSDKPPSPQKQSQSSRQALAPKSTNSPTKRRPSSVLLKKDSLSTESGDEKKPKTSRATAATKIGKPQRIDLTTLNETKNSIAEDSQPKTPGGALIEVMSPESVPTEASTKGRTTTKAEIAFTNSLEDVLNGSIGRGSRRARAAVSYAEPNLRDKMRRPDKKLVGAVEGLGKSGGGENQLSRSLNSEPAELVKERRSLSNVATTGSEMERSKVESEIKDWAALPPVEANGQEKEEATSPLRDKHRTQILERRHKRTFSEVDGTSLKGLNRRPTDEVAKSLEQLSIYDPPSSSPIAPKDDVPERPPSRTNKDILSTSRRASTANTGSTTSTALKTRRHSIQVQQASGNVPSSRPSSAASVRESSSKEASTSRLKRASSVQALGRLQDPTGVNDVADESVVGRTIGTRRRSMMV